MDAHAREAIAGCDALPLGDGNRVHPDALDCLTFYDRRWHDAVTRALAAIGLQPPVNDENTM